MVRDEGEPTASRRARAMLVTAIAVILLAGPGRAQGTQPPSFAAWLTGVRTEAIDKGIRPEIVDAALTGIDEPLSVVLERDRTQAEIVQPLERYLAARLTTKTIATGRQRLTENVRVLDRVSEAYGVPAPLIVAIWGVESNFGRFSGVRPTVAALATLAWDPRRATFFRGELFDALEILNRGDIELDRLKGSWAGAMGQPQFMPSSYLRFAEDFDGDGRRDIWGTRADVFASIANYLKGRGWTAGRPWGREVTIAPDALSSIKASVPRRDGGCRAAREMTVHLSAGEWRERGVRARGGAALSSGVDDGSLVSGTARHFLVHQNYDAILDYNCAHAYALSVALLGDRIASAPSTPAGRPRTR